MYFTTPTLDFSTHADAIHHMIQELYLEYPKLSSKGKIVNVNIILYIFDFLTKFPTKRWIHPFIPEKIQKEKIGQTENKKKDNLNSDYIIKTIQKYLNDFDIENDKDWIVEKEKLNIKPFDIHLSYHTFDPTLSNEQKAYYYYLRGYLYNIFDHFHHLSEKNLSMAVKLNPLLSEAWSELAECYLKKHLLKKKLNSTEDHQSFNKTKTNTFSSNLELTLAKHCLDRAMKIKPTEKTLNNMALTLRKIKTNYLEYKGNIEKSIELSKKSIQYNIKNSSSWASLGITYLENFFNITRDINDLRNSLKAYTIAFSHCSKEESLDILLNKLTTNLYMENYQNGINDLKLINKYIQEKVYKQDQFLSTSLEELFQKNIKKIKKIEQYLEKMSLLIKNKCNIKDKYFLKIEWGRDNPFKQCIDKSNPDFNNDNEITKQDDRKDEVEFESLMISSLKNGKNNNKCIRLRIISEVTSIFGYNRSFIAVDETNHYIALSIYNLNNNFELIGQEILVYEPELFNIKASFEHGNIDYKTIRIDLFSQRSLQHFIEKEWLKQNKVFVDQKSKSYSSDMNSITTIKRMHLFVNGKVLDDMMDIDYSNIMIDCS
ncbi:hypothetical protein BCR36DRAFT_406653 [Piromyces finnis]|uniref:Tetratricopeptide repeat protein 5 OB fold domain-containing protein n=1 Tax=Piromyces finnis TaxID=1754191 RepID=A0A1Y1V1D9_9FUNG|nr:hypothetical protein BCR36DRAFT_406653 [Piromyces finnis]|eukprot:ORX43828.1 hypothetical protein BCR36DRAFT_406653 [Piromyces finnis]